MTTALAEPDAFHTAMRNALERAMDAAWHNERTYLAVPHEHFAVITDIWDDYTWEGSVTRPFCFTGTSQVYTDGAVVLICLLPRGHQGECGSAAYAGLADRSLPALLFSPLFDTYARGGDCVEPSHHNPPYQVGR